MTEDEYNTLAELAEKMRSDAQNLKCRELKAGIFQKNKALNNCFLGTDAADWILRHSTASTRDEAVAICSRMMHAKLMRAVTPNGAITAGYQDAGDSFFQMSADAMKPTIGDPLNMSSLWDSDSRPAGEVATDLRKLIVALYDKFLSADGRGVDYDGMGKDPLFRQYITATTELQKVSIDQLGREERMAFFINIYNAIIVHGTAIYGPPASLPERLKWFKALKYNIGGLEYSAGGA